MAEDDIAVDVEPDMVTIRCRNLIGKALRANQNVLEFEQLTFNLDVPLPVVSKTVAKAVARSVLAKIATKAEFILDQTRKPVEDEVKKLIDEVEDFCKKDGRGDTGAYKQALDAIKKTVARIEDLVEAAPAKIRKVIETEIKGDASYRKEKLHSSGTWGFRSNKGIGLKAGRFKNVAGADHDAKASDELRKALEGAKNASASAPYDFVLASGRQAGLVIRKRVSGADKKTAIERREGGGQVYFGEVLYEKSKYVFVLDKDCSVGEGARLAKQIQQAVQDATGRRYPIRVVGQGYGEEEAGDA